MTIGIFYLHSNTKFKLYTPKCCSKWHFSSSNLFFIYFK